MGKKKFVCQRCRKEFEKNEETFRTTSSPAGINVHLIRCDDCQEKARKEGKTR
jgi:DNA-directed RNA polymerase subunit RPC12/RpoP